jgi:predicted nucleotide-binding protein
MEREKQYDGSYLREIGWRNLVQASRDVFGEPLSISCTVWRGSGTWAYDKLEDFLAEFNPESSDLFIHFEERVMVRLSHYTNFEWFVRSKEKVKIVDFETRADNIIHDRMVPEPVPEPQIEKVPTVFIGHGRHADWRDLKDHLQDKHGMQIEAYETGSRSGHTIRDVLGDMLEGSELAILVHTPEDELADGSFNTRPNVIHETGLFQGKLGFARAIILLKDGANEFTNVSGVQQIRYQTIGETYGDILSWIKRESN